MRQGAQTTPLFIGIDHPAMSCRDVRGLARWYCQHLGMAILADNGEEPASLLVGYQAGGAMIELMPVRDEGPEPRTLARFAPGLRHIAINVRNFDQAFAALKEAGVEYLFAPVVALGGGRIVSFRDPEGNELQIVERPAGPGPTK